MTDQTEAPAATPARQPNARPQLSKAATVEKLLSRIKGATLAELVEATSWKPHTVRAFLTGLRKKGLTLLRETRTSGETNWRIER